MPKKPEVGRFPKWPRRMIQRMSREDQGQQKSVFAPKEKITFALVKPKEKR